MGNDYAGKAMRGLRSAKRSRIRGLEVMHLRKARTFIQARLREISRKRRKGYGGH